MIFTAGFQKENRFIAGSQLLQLFRVLHRVPADNLPGRRRLLLSTTLFLFLQQYFLVHADQGRSGSTRQVFLPVRPELRHNGRSETDHVVPPLHRGGQIDCRIQDQCHENAKNRYSQSQPRPQKERVSQPDLRAVLGRISRLYKFYGGDLLPNPGKLRHDFFQDGGKSHRKLRGMGVAAHIEIAHVRVNRGGDVLLQFLHGQLPVHLLIHII